MPPVPKSVSSEGRVIAHVDMDCFYVQVEQRKQPELRGLPTAVIQYNSWKGGALIAVSYEARKCGVKRSMRGDEAKKVCPEIQLVQVPVSRGKADLNTYRAAGSEVISVLAKKGRCERASIDEVYLDLTDAAETMLAESPPESLEDADDEALKSHIIGLSEDGTNAKEKVKNWFCRSDADHNEKLLACGALIVAQLRIQVLKETQFTCSAGIAHNKMLAKLASGMNKPAQQTVVPATSVREVLMPLPIKKMKQLGGKLGDSLQNDLGIKTVGDLLQFSMERLQERYGVNTGTWLWNIARGISGEEVEGRILPKSHGSGKTFPGPCALKTIGLVEHWLNELCEELGERLVADLEQNKRIAHTLTVNARAYKQSSDTDSQKNFPSKSCPLRYGTAKIQEDALNLFHAGLREYMGSYGVKVEKNQNNGWAITALSVSASKIVAIPSGTCTIMKFFPSQNPVCCTSSQQSKDSTMHETTNFVSSGSSHSGYEINSASIELTMAREHVVEDGIPGTCQLEQKRKLWDEVVSSVMRDQAPSCSSLNEAPTQGTSCLSALESKCFSEKSQAEPPRLQSEQHQCLSVRPVLERQEQRRKKSKVQGTSSILRFLKSSDNSKHKQTEVLQEARVPSSSASLSVSGEAELPTANVAEDVSRTDGNEMCGGWSYNVNEIDPNVIHELPLQIQEEVRSWLRQQKQPPSPKSSASGSTITRYFFPTKSMK
ncbi:hypothetical protein Ancab_021631 [Ancistrocladus abbreviatus]